MSDEFNETIITIAAVCVSLIGNTVNAIGYIIEKKAHTSIQQANALLPASQQKSYTRDCLWISGFLTFALGSLLHAGALAFGPQSLLTPVTSVTLVANTFLAHKYLGEALRKQDILGTILIVTGCVMAIIFGPRASDREQTTANDLLLGFTNLSFTIFFTTTTAAVLIDYIAVKIVEKRNQRMHENAVDVIQKSFAQLPMTPTMDKDNSEGNVKHDTAVNTLTNGHTINTNTKANRFDSLSKTNRFDSLSKTNRNFPDTDAIKQTQSSMDEKKQKDNNDENENSKLSHRIYKGRTFLMLSLTLIAAYWGSSTALLTKAFGELMVALFTSTWNGAVQLLTSPGTYAIIVAFILANILMEYWKQKALSTFGALYVIPIYQVGMIIGGTLFGAMFFNEFEDLTSLYLFLFSIAIAIDVVGVSILASSTGIKEHVKVYNIVRKQLLVMKAMKAFLALGNIHSTNIIHKSSFIGQIMNDADTEKDAMLNLINREAKKLQQFKDPELLNTGTGAKDLHAMQAVNEVEAIQYQYTMGGVLAPVFYNQIRHKRMAHSPRPPVPYTDNNNWSKYNQNKPYKRGYYKPPMQNEQSQSVSSMDREYEYDEKEQEYVETSRELFKPTKNNKMMKVATYSSNTLDTPSMSKGNRNRDKKS